MSPSLPGSKMWNASLVSYVQVTDWDYNSGGVILFDDGTMWSYESESPAAGDTDGYAWQGFCISERKVDSDVWERLTPDLWGFPYLANPPDYPNWPTYGMGGYGRQIWEGYDREGPLNVATIGTDTSNWVHIQYPDDPDNILFYSNFDTYWTGPVTVNRHTRRWKTHLRNSAALEIWQNIASFIVTDGTYFYFMVWSRAPDNYQSFARCPIGDLNAVEIVHTWDEYYGPLTSIDTSNITLPDYIDNQAIGDYASLAIDGDQIYFFSVTNGVIKDERTTSFSSGDESQRNHNIKFQQLRRFKIGEYELETLMWHSMPQGWVGYGGANYGTLLDDTIGVTTQSDHSHTSRSNVYPALGMGLMATNQHAMVINDGWLYWLDWSGSFFGGYNDTYGTGEMVCRIDLAKLDPSEPIHHDVMNPAFEILTNGSAPWEGNTDHIGWYQGTWIWARTGAQPLLPRADNVPFTFDSDGNLFYKGMLHPNHYYTSDGGGYGTRAIYKLTPNIKSVTDVVVTFTGDELKGYTNARQVPVTRDVMEVELS